MKKIINEMKVRLPSHSENEALARTLVSALCALLDPTVEELTDLRLAVSEAVTNCIVHAYRDLPDDEFGYIYISLRLYDNREITVEVSDNGCGIEDVQRAREPFFTTCETDERCGMGFLVMESFTDRVTVKSKVGKGTSVLLRKIFSPHRSEEE